MTTRRIAMTYSFGKRMGLLLALVMTFAAMLAHAEAPAPALTAEQFDKLVGPIALYPDDLVAIILPASTNPLQIVQAERFLEKRKTDPKLAVDEKWDDPVKALLNYPDVVKKMSNELDWTTALGEAVATDQGAVLEAIQVFRRKTQSAGNLGSDGKQVVVVEKEVIKIVQADPQVIYVPQYNPATVVIPGSPTYTYYPTPYPVYYYPYPPGATFAAGMIWGAAITAAWHGGWYHADYHRGGANINIDRSVNISTGDININRPGGARPTPYANSTQWKPSRQPGQVSHTTASTSGRVGYGTASQRSTSSAGTRPSAQQPSAQSTARPSAQPAMQSVGDSRSSGSAFSGYSSGRQTQMDSARGAASRGSMSGGFRGRR